LSLVKKLTFAAPEAEDDSSDEEDWEGEVEVYDADEDTVESRTPVQRNFVSFRTPYIIMLTYQLFRVPS